jgi:hypothetical protein
MSSPPFGKSAAFGIVAVCALAAIAQPRDEPAAGQDPPAAKPSEAKNRGGFPDLVKGLKETPGCLGVETARTGSGKSVIFAWFENKKAVLAWYRSKMHRDIMDSMGGPTRKPLEQVPDDDQPVLAIASITMSDKPKIEGIPMPISQIAIELYRPLPGGAAAGGTFAPDSLKVPNMNRYDEGDEAEAQPQPEP